MLALLLTAGCATTPTPGQPALEATATAEDARLVQAGWAQLEERRFAQAARAFERVLGRQPEHREAKRGLAEAKLGAGRAAEAQALFEELVALDPDDAAALEGLGVAQFTQGDATTARQSLEGALQNDEARWRSWHTLARLHDRGRGWTEADAAYARALALAPRKELIHTDWGTSLMARGRYPEAAEHFRSALELRPEQEATRINLQLAYASMGRYDDVIAATSREELPRVLNNLGFVAMQKGELARAEAYFVQALEASPSFYPRVWQNLQQLERLKRASSPS